MFVELPVKIDILRGMFTATGRGNTMKVIDEPYHATAGEVAYRRIRDDIVLGRLPPGRRLTLDRMRDTYGASVSTLREMFNRLASEGLIDA